MHHRVPDCPELEDDDSIPTPSICRPGKPTAGEEEIMELIWKNGHVVVQSQNQRSRKRSASGGVVVLPAEREIRPSAEEQQQQHLFMQEDEMSWLHYPLDDSSFDGDFYADLLNSAHPPPTLTTATAHSNRGNPPPYCDITPSTIEETAASKKKPNESKEQEKNKAVKETVATVTDGTVVTKQL